MSERMARRTGSRARRVATVAIAAGVALAAAVAIPMTASAAPATATNGFAGANDAAIRPGVQLATPVSDDLAEFCTANFVFSGGDGVYLGTAAHCVADLTSGAGEDADGCNANNFPLDKEVIVTGRDGKEYSAKLAYSSWRTMKEKGVSDATDPDLCQYNDFALLKLSPEAKAVTNPTVPDFGGPTGVDTNGTRLGNRVFSYQPNILKDTPDKQGFSLGQPMGPRTHVVATMPPGVSGDSGSGYLGSNGQAFGLLSTQFLDPTGHPTGLNGVTDLSKALAYANTVGGMGDVGLVNGTEPFTPIGPSMTRLPLSLPSMPPSMKPALP